MVIISIVAAAIAPTVDPVNIGLVMLPRIALDFVSIGPGYLAYSGRRIPEENITAQEGTA